MNRSSTAQFAALVQSFFTEHLTQQKNVSPRTVASYRDAFRLLFGYLQKRHGKRPTQLAMADLKAPTLLGFLEYLEKVRHNTIRTRNARWAALRSFLQYALAVEGPDQLGQVRGALAIPLKRCSRKMLGFLSREEVQAVLQAPAAGTWSGQRDRLLLQLLYNTGARVSEIIGVRVEDLRDDRSLQLLGKGRKLRTVPLWRSSYRMLRQWIRHAKLQPGQPILTNRWGQSLTRSGVAKRLTQAVRAAIPPCPSLRNRRISPHTLRRTTAMHLLQAGVTPEVIALWLGHESPVTTHRYVEADLALKEQALEKVQPPTTKQLRFRPKDDLLCFLDELSYADLSTSH
jgi:integrase/recombinase XerD